MRQPADAAPAEIDQSAVTGPAPADVAAAERVIETTRRFTGAVFSLETDRVELADGLHDRDVVRHPGAVGVIAVDDADRVVLVRQYRHAVGSYLWEPPAGLLDRPGEPLLAAARRELQEEAHLLADRWATLVDAYTTPGMSDERLRIFLATGLREATGERHRGAGEERDMPVERFAVADVLGQVLAGRLHNPVLLLGLPLLVAIGGAAGADRLRAADAPWQPAV